MTRPALRLVRAVLPVLALGVAVSACSQPPRNRATAAAMQKCRMEVDRVYAAQNRVDLSTRDTRDTPFASNYNSGITTRGLGAQYGRDNMTQSCMNEAITGSGPASAAGTASTGPTFSTSPSSASK